MEEEITAETVGTSGVDIWEYLVDVAILLQQIARHCSPLVAQYESLTVIIGRVGELGIGAVV